MDYTTVNYSPVLAPAPPVPVFDKALATTDFSPGSRANLPALPGSGPLVRQILAADYQLRYRAAMIGRAMEHAATLSAMETQFYNAAPAGWRRYRALADSYTLAAVAAIAKGG